MSHRDTRELLPDFAQGRLEAEGRAAIEEHLAVCPACREWLETYHLLGRALAAQEETEHPDSADLAAWAARNDELPPGAAAHLEGCAECGREVELLTAAIRAARGAEQIEEVESRRLRPRRGRMAIAWTAAASLVLLVLAGSLLLDFRGDEERDYVISGVTLSGEETISARSIHASAAKILPGSAVVFEAGELIALGEDFVVASGATFEAGNSATDADGTH